jgi:hypothetical protein
MSTHGTAYKNSVRSRERALLQRPAAQFGIGRRWIGCGWRLFLRNPWQFGGMGLVSAIVFLISSSIPLFGGALTALIGPIFLASAYLATEEASMQKRTVPRSKRKAALIHSPNALLRTFDDEQRSLLVFAVSVYFAVAVVLLNILEHLVTGGPYPAGSWLSIGVGPLLGQLTAALLILALHLVVAAPVIYALPLVFFQNESLIPAMLFSVRMSLRHVFALLVVLGLLLGLYFLGVVAALWSGWAKHLVWLLAGPVVLPLAVTSAYCSYRTVFPRERSAEACLGE